MIVSHLDELVMSGRITGYSIEEDPRYLMAQRPTLTYRMYASGADSHLNLGAFSAAMAELASSMRLSRVEGVVPATGRLRRSRQLCLTVEFSDGASLGRALGVVRRRFTAAATAAPGSWRYPDVRVAGATSAAAAAAYAHAWPHGKGSAVVLTLSQAPPLSGARTYQIGVLPSWLSLLGGGVREPLSDPGATWLPLSA